MTFLKPDSSHVPQAVALAYKSYLKQSATSPFPVCDAVVQLEQGISALFEKGTCLAVMDDSHMLGYLGFRSPIEGFFGNCKGAYSPLYGSAMIENEHSGKLLSLLFEQLAADLSKQGVTSYALTKYADDTPAGQSLVLNGFGIRCGDSINTLSALADALPPFSDCSVRELSYHEGNVLFPLFEGLCGHLLGSPTFFPTKPMTPERFQSHYLNGNRFFVAYDGENPIGYIKLSDEGENFITLHQSMLNISGAYVLPQYRGQQISQAILSYIVNALQQEGYTHLGVDCETVNPTALHFWGKYFTPYTYSYHRRIDERALHL